METDRDSQRVTLRDGRQLGFAEYGKPDGIPLMLFHGTPGSRLMTFLEQAEWIQRLGFRILTPERPGYGLSDPAPGHTIGDWADDVAQLADQLGLDRFHVAGGSGGGPFALACALNLPARVRSATLICSGSPPEFLRISKDMNRGNRVAFFLARYAPPLLRLLHVLMARKVRKWHEPQTEKEKKKRDAARKKTLSQLCEWDRHSAEARKDDPRAILQLKEAFRQGGAGSYHDMMLVSHAWGLDLTSNTVPVFLWHGTADTLVPVSSARAFARAIPGCQAHFIQDAGHMLLGSKELSSEMMGRIASIADKDVCIMTN
jgi:pimeloyl-ACP methyl ester carboxylesterase